MWISLNAFPGATYNGFCTAVNICTTILDFMVDSRVGRAAVLALSTTAICTGYGKVNPSQEEAANILSFRSKIILIAVSIFTAIELSNRR